jgi:hypothetical protein
VLDFGMASGHDAISTLARGLLGLRAAAPATAAADAAFKAQLLDAERRVYLNDLLDLPQQVELRALYDATTTPPAIAASRKRWPSWLSSSARGSRG